MSNILEINKGKGWKVSYDKRKILGAELCDGGTRVSLIMENKTMHECVCFDTQKEAHLFYEMVKKDVLNRNNTPPTNDMIYISHGIQDLMFNKKNFVSLRRYLRDVYITTTKQNDHLKFEFEDEAEEVFNSIRAQLDSDYRIKSKQIVEIKDSIKQIEKDIEDIKMRD